MGDAATFLHIADPHVSGAGVAYPRDDLKAGVPAIRPGTRGDMLELLLSRLAERLRLEDRRLDGVLFSGDAQDRGAPGGHELVFRLLVERLGPFGITAGRIVATPGNHDVPRDTPPSTPERYAPFNRVWRDAGCVVPWLDGVDAWPPAQRFEGHRLMAEDGAWAVFPVNTSNWSNVAAVLPAPLRDLWDRIPETMSPEDAGRAAELRDQLQAMARYDMARVSERQLEALRTMVASAPPPPQGRQLRIAVMHHHLRSPSLREELKPFSDISNLEQVRAFVRGSGIDVVIHGHKHERAAYFDHVYAEDEEDVHRVLVVSGATFDVGRETDAMRLITIGGLPHVPEVRIEPLSLPRAGAEWRKAPAITRRLWTTPVGKPETVVASPGIPTVVAGSDLDEVYARARAVAKAPGERGTLVVHLDLPDDGSGDLPLPRTYPVPDGMAAEERQGWLGELVAWWQLGRSHLEHRIPYIHGARLRRFGGKVDQIRRVTDLLRSKASTRAIAVLVDPFRDFTVDGSGEQFASLCLIEFRRREMDDGVVVVDAIAFYRVQEIERWWPINVAELRHLQRGIAQELGFRPGRITTVAAEARTISRSPTQVAMPSIDRWLDQAPERLSLLADALVRRMVRSPGQATALQGWERSLVDLRVATEAFNPDGLPVAIEGLQMLAGIIRATAAAEDDTLPAFAATLGQLALVNETFERSPRGRVEFARWSPVARGLIETLELQTAALLPMGKRGGQGGDQAPDPG